MWMDNLVWIYKIDFITSSNGRYHKSDKFYHHFGHITTFENWTYELPVMVNLTAFLENYCNFKISTMKNSQ